MAQRKLAKSPRANRPLPTTRGCIRCDAKYVTAVLAAINKNTSFKADVGVTYAKSVKGVRATMWVELASQDPKIDTAERLQQELKRALHFVSPQLQVVCTQGEAERA